MNVKLRYCFFVSTLVLMFGTKVDCKILPSLISHFRELTPKPSTLPSITGLSRIFGKKNPAAREDRIKISPQFGEAVADSPTKERQLGAAENYAAFDISFETTEIKDAVSFIEFKMKEITSLVKECIEQEYENDATADIYKIKHECVGKTYQILFFNYNEGMKKIKGLLMEILKLKLQNLKEDYEDETNFFLDVLESLVDKDYTIPKSLELAKKASKYYVSPRYFDKLVEITEPEIKAFTELHERLREQRDEIQTDLNEKQHNEETYIHNIERKAKQLGRKVVRHHKHSRRLPLDSVPQNRRGYPNGFPKANPSYSGYDLQKNAGLLPPENSQQSAYLDKVEKQLDGLSLFHNPAMPDEKINLGQSNNFRIPISGDENMAYRV